VLPIGTQTAYDLAGMRPSIRSFGLQRQKESKPPKDETKPPKDFWDKLDIFGKVFIALVAAAATVVVANIGGQVQKVVTTQSTGKDFVQIALGILEKKDLTEEMQKNPGLRKWAVGLLNHYSDVALDDDTAKKLIGGEPLPKVDLDIQEKALALPWPFNLLNGPNFKSYNRMMSHHREKSFGTLTIEVDYSESMLHFTRSQPRADGKSDFRSFTREFPSTITDVHFENDVVVVQTEDGKVTKLNLEGHDIE
jgi:hypothetical protein